MFKGRLSIQDDEKLEKSSISTANGQIASVKEIVTKAIEKLLAENVVLVTLKPPLDKTQISTEKSVLIIKMYQELDLPIQLSTSKSVGHSGVQCFDDFQEVSRAVWLFPKWRATIYQLLIPAAVQNIGLQREILPQVENFVPTLTTHFGLPIHERASSSSL
ncbi:hypothetical protein HNY73_014142 [Argiope bruennichi]|uniref:Uncharacterized protein n=1 Tax=Argiope bruennichi TaxID=94029 RepID=A0A8T0ES98_ARGBR|nr:hypothetical protein HNY73_014142 [Argiope bruennichi]